MKLQDIGFIVLLITTIALRRPRLSIILGLACFLLSIPLFANWTFFTAQRLTYYGAAFILLAVAQMLFRISKK